MITVIFTAREIYIIKPKVYLKTLKHNSIKILFIISCVLILLIIPFRLTCNPDVEDVLIVIAVLAMSSKFLYFFRLVLNAKF